MKIYFKVVPWQKIARITVWRSMWKCVFDLFFSSMSTHVTQHIWDVNSDNDVFLIFQKRSIPFSAVCFRILLHIKILTKKLGISEYFENRFRLNRMQSDFNHWLLLKEWCEKWLNWNKNHHINWWLKQHWTAMNFNTHCNRSTMTKKKQTMNWKRWMDCKDLFFILSVSL